jgi:hypothetical protein
MADRKSYLPGPTQRPALLLLCCMPYIASTWAADIATSLPQTTCVDWNKVATITTRGKTEDEGFRGTVTQTLDTQDWSGASHYLNSRTAQSISVTKAWLRRRGWCQPNLESTEIVALPDNTDGGVAETVWRVTPSNRVAAILRTGSVAESSPGAHPARCAAKVARVLSVAYGYGRCISHRRSEFS